MRSVVILFFIVTSSWAESVRRPPKKCSEGPSCGVNAHYEQDSYSCEKTCANRFTYDSMGACAPSSRCFCDGGYMRLNDDASGPCVTEDQCPKLPLCGQNEVAKSNKTTCPPQICQSLYIKFSCAKTDPEPGCDCIENHLRDSNGNCIPKKQCPPPPVPLPECGENEVPTNDRIICPPQTCESIYTSYPCALKEPEPGCNCIDGYLRNASNICIPSELCPSAPVPLPECGENEVPTNDRIICPPQTCESIYTSYPCAPKEPEPGCNCIDGYLRNASNICIPSELCPSAPVPLPECGENEVQTNDGCNCKDGYLRDASNQCVPSKLCQTASKSSSQSSSYSSSSAASSSSSIDSGSGANPKCSVPKRCRKSCSNPNPKCPTRRPPHANVDGCECKRGYLLSDVSGKCIKEKQCRVEIGCNGDPNASYNECPTSCPATCDNPNAPNGICIQACAENKCVCNPGYLLLNGKCVLPEECPAQPGCNGDPNAAYNDCPTSCPATCENPNAPNGICTLQCAENKCVCNPGYLLLNGKCVLPEECPTQPGCNGDPNASYNDCPTSCPATCENPNAPNGICTRQCAENKCVCNPGYLLLNGKCVLPEECPAQPGCNGDPNASYNDCPTSCPATCENPNAPNGICTLQCAENKCVCNPGYLLLNGKCVLPEECPTQPGCNGDPNASYNDCPTSCPATCENPNAPNGICTLQCAENKCVCNPGYLLLNGKCVLPEECPTQPGCNGDPNASYNDCPTSCPATCENPNAPNGICTLQCAENKCVCNPGYLLLNGKCVLPEECPAQPGCNGDPNASYNDCPTSCPATCEDPNAPNGICTRQCAENKCVCNPGYLLLNGKCVLPEECPAQPGCNGDPNASYNDCPTSCPATCKNPNAPNGICTLQCAENKCVCNPGYLLLNGKCVLPEECPTQPGCNGDPNASYNDCPTSCPATCENPNAPNGICTLQCAENKCVCNPGYLLLNGKCVLPEECPAQPGCNGDPNASYNDCPTSCPATCENPNAPNGICTRQCAENKCVCNPGYLLLNGKCVLPEECPGGDPCGPNGTFVECGFRCPNQYCPEDDSRVAVACKPGRPCAPGCACKLNYKRESYEDDRCILAPECPQRECTRPNEVWSPCTTECLAESCENVNDSQTTCNTFVLNCQPKCICKEGFFRDSNDICIPAKDCPQKGCNGDPNASYNECPTSCPATCENPNAPNGICIQACADNKCVCNPGYLLLNGKCVLPEECPVDIGCNGDPNAVYNECPTSCPATCENPDAPNGPCVFSCALNKCECKPGYLLLNGKCVLPEECPVKKTCPANEIFVNCAVRCPNTYCPKDDSRGILICDPPYNCPSGCVCDRGYLRKSEKDDVCVEASKCPPVKCTRPNEEWNPSPPNCIAERCSDANKPPATCDKRYRDYTPKCMCKQGFYRNDSDICVPARECSNNNPDESDCIPTCANPNPVNCPSDQDKNQCDTGNILSEMGGKCIKIEDCPRGCNGDPDAIAMECPAACPSTCDKPESLPCSKSCSLRECECAQGYILSESKGQCIKVDDCPGGNPCGDNGIFAPCKSGCPTDYCPVDDNRGVVICETYPFSPCFPGCICKVNHKRKSREDKRCILSSDCPPVNCTRQNEEWSSCPEACLAESCNDVGKPPVICYTLLLNCEPRCVCKKNYYRNSTDICVSPAEC